jgi:hypothetical protein
METSQYGFQRDESNARAIYRRRDISFCQVRRSGATFFALEFVTASDWHFLGDSKVKSSTQANSGSSPNVLTHELSYDISSGAEPKSLLFSFDMPHTGIEIFYLPMYEKLVRTADLNQGIAGIQAPALTNPSFRGAWAYQIKKNANDRVVISGLRNLGDEDNLFRIVATSTTDVTLSPLWIHRCEYDAMITCANLNLNATDIQKFGLHIISDELKLGAKYERAAAVLRVRMVPFQAEEAKSMEMPKSLQSYLNEHPEKSK